MDDSGQPGGGTPGQNGNGTGHYPGQQAGRARLNGWAAVDDVWSSAGAALEPVPDPVGPGWRATPAASGTTPAHPPPGHPASERDEYLSADDLRVPASAPPYPYEGDLEDARLLDGWPPEPSPAQPAPPAEPRSQPPVEPRFDERRPPSGPEPGPARHSIAERTPPGGMPVAWREPLDRGNPTYQGRTGYDRRGEPAAYGAPPAVPPLAVPPVAAPSAASVAAPQAPPPQQAPPQQAPVPPAPVSPASARQAPGLPPPAPQGPPYAAPASDPSFRPAGGSSGYRTVAVPVARPDSRPVSGPPQDGLPRPTSAPPRPSSAPPFAPPPVPAKAPTPPVGPRPAAGAPFAPAQPAPTHPAPTHPDAVPSAGRYAQAGAPQPALHAVPQAAAPAPPGTGYADRPTRLQRAYFRESLESGYGVAPESAAPAGLTAVQPVSTAPVSASPAAEPAVPPVPPGYQPAQPGESAAPVQHRFEPIRPRHAPAETAPQLPPPAAGRVDEVDTLPQRVPAPPDVPNFTAPDANEPPAETNEIARIANGLRQAVFGEQAERPAGFDVPAVLAAVREVPGVRDAHLRTNEAGAHTLRLDLADGADPGAVSREVARLLGERMGLAAAPQSAPPQVADRSSPPPGVVPQLSGGLPPASARTAAVAPTDRAAALPSERTGRATIDRTDEQVRGGAEGGYEPRRRQPSPGPSVTAGAARSAAEPRQAPPLPAGYDPLGGYLAPQAGPAPEPPRPLSPPGTPGPRVIIDHVQVSSFGLDATVEVRLAAGRQHTVGSASGPAVDGYVLRLCAVATGVAIDDLLRGAEPGADRGRCFVEHAAVVPFGSCEVAVVVVLLVCGGWVEQLAGSALVAGDPRQAVVRATLAAVNRRLEGLLS